MRLSLGIFKRSRRKFSRSLGELRFSIPWITISLHFAQTPSALQLEATGRPASWAASLRLLPSGTSIVRFFFGNVTCGISLF